MLLFAGAVHDRLSRGWIHPVSLWVASGMFVWANLRAVVIGPSETWHAFASWLILAVRLHDTFLRGIV